MSLRPGEDVGQAQGIVALNPETGTTTQGETIEEAVANLREAIALDLEGFPWSCEAVRGDDVLAP